MKQKNACDEKALMMRIKIHGEFHSDVATSFYSLVQC